MFFGFVFFFFTIARFNDEIDLKFFLSMEKKTKWEFAAGLNLDLGSLSGSMFLFFLFSFIKLFSLFYWSKLCYIESNGISHSLCHGGDIKYWWNIYI